MNKKLNVKYLVIIVLTVIFVILLGINIYLYVIKKPDNKEVANTNNESNNSTTEIDENSRVEELKQALYNNFLIAYIIDGDIQVGDGELIVDGSDESYYAVTDYLLQDIHSLSDINDLINNNILDITATRIAKIQESDYANQYAVSKNTLYVKKTKTPCFRTDQKLDLSSNKYRLLEGDSLSIVYERVPYTFRLDDDGNIKANTLWFTCVKDIGSIKTGKDDKFEPTDEDLFKPSDFVYDD